jgi:flagellar protein FliO/FliZ
MLELTIRLIVSLAIVLGLLILLARLGARRFSGSHGAMVEVLHRQPLSRTSSLAVVSVSGRVLVLGTTEHQVSLLAELEPDEVLADAEDTLADTAADLTGDLTAAFELAGPHGRHLVPAPRTVRAVAGPGKHAATRDPVERTGTAGPLAGSVLSPQTWRDALAAATRRAS